MFKGGRFFYSVFMCHLAVEKALKGLYQERLKEIPPRVHNLIYLLNKMGVRPPELQGKFLVRLNEASVPTRYPETLETLQKNYTHSIVEDILVDTKGLLEWIKSQR
jgi:HEPN domain-containing protein